MQYTYVIQESTNFLFWILKTQEKNVIILSIEI